MEYRTLGRSGLKVSKMSLGTNAFGTRADEPTSIAIVHQALDAGINLLDTANVYGKGESERIMGKALKGRRSQAVLATKCAMRVAPEPNGAGASRQHILDSVDASLKRLDTDYIDLYQMHEWDPTTPLEETLETLNDLVRWGKVRYIGCSNYSGWQLVKALWISDRRGLARFVSSQPEYSPANRTIERELVPAGLSEGVGQIVYFPLAGGVFTGKYQPGAEPPVGSRAVTQGESFTKRFLSDRNFYLLTELSKVAKETELELPHLVLAWAMAKPGVTSAIVGATKVEQLLSNLKACDVTLSDDVMKQVDGITAV